MNFEILIFSLRINGTFLNILKQLFVLTLNNFKQLSNRLIVSQVMLILKNNLNYELMGLIFIST